MPRRASSTGMAYDNSTEIAVYNLSDGSFKQYIPLSRTIDQAQGGKILDGWMYFSTESDKIALSRQSDDRRSGRDRPARHSRRPGSRGSLLRLDQGWLVALCHQPRTARSAARRSGGFYHYLRPTAMRSPARSIPASRAPSSRTASISTMRSASASAQRSAQWARHVGGHLL